jgi:hypothetical protein
LAGVGALLSAAGGLYLVVSMVLLLAQRGYVSGQPVWLFGLPEMLRVARQERIARHGVVPLDSLSQLDECGNKVVRLAMLRAHGVPVPDGVVLNTGFLRQLAARAPEARQAFLENALKALSGDTFAVRSSAAGEDGAEDSFAGVYDSVLDVPRGALAQAVDEVADSFASERSQHYRSTGGDGNVLVQQMVDADYAGVLFTRDPAGPGAMLVELVEGTADALVSGLTAPKSLRFGVGSHTLLGEMETPIDLAPLLDIAKRCQAIFGQPQDIEWVYKEGRFMIVQTRDITALAGHKDSATDREWQRLVALAGAGDGDEVVLHQDAMSEVLPQPTPYSFALMQRLWASGGSVDMACRQLGLAYPVDEQTPTQLACVFGRLYTDPRREHANAAQMSRLAAHRLRRNGERIADAIEHEFLPAFGDDIGVLEAVDFGKLSDAKLFELAETTADAFVHDTHVQVEVVNVAAAFFMGEARRRLEDIGLPAAKWLGSDHEPRPIQAIRRALALPEAERDAALVAAAGHRSVFDYELSQPRYHEDQQALAAYCGAFAPLTGPANAEHAMHMKESPIAPDVSRAVAMAKRFELLKETAKDQSLRQLAVLRAILLALDARLGLDGGIFHLTPDELAEAGRTGVTAGLSALICKRQDERRELLDVPPLPATLTRAALEAYSVPGLNQAGRATGAIGGSLVAGCGNVFGRARVVDATACEAG